MVELSRSPVPAFIRKGIESRAYVSAPMCFRGA